jgi:hypothetical protein
LHSAPGPQAKKKKKKKKKDRSPGCVVDHGSRWLGYF